MWSHLTDDRSDDVQVSRMQVPGGWLYRVEYWEDECRSGQHNRVLRAMNTEFVRDPGADQGESKGRIGGAPAPSPAPISAPPGTRIDAFALGLELAAMRAAALRERERGVAGGQPLEVAWKDGALQALDAAMAAVRKLVG